MMKTGCLIFGVMHIRDSVEVMTEQKEIFSSFLDRKVIVDFYIPKNFNEHALCHLLLINDGQDLPKMKFTEMLGDLKSYGNIAPVFCAGIHAGVERKMEYGTARITDCKGRGAKAAAYNRFILEELLPHISGYYPITEFASMNLAGFSLGGLTAIDIVWHYPQLFSKVGVFSGSLWWRSREINKGYNEDTDRIMHRQVREGKYNAGLQFYFTTGSLDEVADRNNNGIIDSIDDTLGLIEELKKKGYTDKDIEYHNFEDGRHDVATWGKAMPGFLLWGWGTRKEPELQTVNESC